MSSKKVLVTRPLRQGRALCAAIEQAGGTAVHFPGVEIESPKNKSEVLSRLKEIANCDWVIFVSTNAVDYANDCLGGNLPHALKSTKVAVVGKATRKALENQDIKVDLSPQQRFNSEALLAKAELNNVTGKQILIIRGNGGRQLLGDTLIRRGAKVIYAEVYRRFQPARAIQPLIRLWETEGIDAATVTSCEVLDNMIRSLDSAGGKLLLQATPLVVVSQRIKERAQEFGVEEVRVTNSVSDTAIIDTVCDLLREV